jgi:carotenoid 1,2-hydratase
VARSATTLAIGPSRLSWDGSALVIDIDEVGVPIPLRVRGRVRVAPEALHAMQYALDDQAVHTWQPIAPRARISVELEDPALRWQGAAYLDSNRGDAPLAEAFRGWHWARAEGRDSTSVLYDVTLRNGERRRLTLRFGDRQAPEHGAPPPAHALPLTGWRVQREMRSEKTPIVLRTLEDTPFYARSLIAAQLDGDPVTAVHESLDLDRFEQRWVQTLLPFRAPRSWR